jgi:ParB-like chromosome segregation protein Spo0J
VLFDREPLDTLKRSIEKVGILVPLTVYWAAKRRSWIILDGQRRWLCARELALKKVPVNQVAEPDLVQNIVTMFQIHRLREDWELMPTALKLEVLMEALEEKREKQLAVLTGLDPAVVVRCKKLLSYPRKYQELMLDPDPPKRVKADFFIELHAVLKDRHVKRMGWFSRDRFTSEMLSRYTAGHLTAVTDFRQIKQYVNNAAKAHKVGMISKRLREFAEHPELPLEHLSIPEAAVTVRVRAVMTAATKLEQVLRDLDVNDYYAEEALWRELERLAQLIRFKLTEVNRRLRP